MKMTLLLVLNLPLIVLPSACSRRPPANGQSFPGAASTSESVSETTGGSLQEQKTGSGTPADGDGLGLEALGRQIQRMKPPELLEAARDCKRQLTETDAALRSLTHRLETMALTDRLSPDARQVTSKLLELKTAQATLTKHLDLYKTALMAYGAALEE